MRKSQFEKVGFPSRYIDHSFGSRIKHPKIDEGFPNAHTHKTVFQHSAFIHIILNHNSTGDNNIRACSGAKEWRKHTSKRRTQVIDANLWKGTQRLIPSCCPSSSGRWTPCHRQWSSHRPNRAGCRSTWSCRTPWRRRGWRWVAAGGSRGPTHDPITNQLTRANYTSTSRETMA